MVPLGFKDLISLLSIGSLLVIVTIVFKYGKTRGALAYGVALSAALFWIADLLPYRLNLFGQVVLWTRLAHAFAAFTSTSFLCFALVFPNRKNPRWVEMGIGVETLLMAALCFHPYLLIKGAYTVPGRENIILFGPLFFLYFLHIVFFFFAGFIVFYRKFLKSAGEERSQITYILLGYFSSASIAMFTNLVLPFFFHNFDLYWLGQVFSVVVAVVSSYAIINHHLLNIRMVSTEIFVAFLLMLLALHFVFSFSAGRYVTNGLMIAAVIFLSIKLRDSVRSEVQRRHQISTLAKSLEKANIRLKELDRQKTDFLSIAAHQLRTPMSIFNGYFELMKDGAYGPITSETGGVLDNMDESNRRLVKLVDSFLDITRLEQGRTKYDFKFNDLGKLASGVVRELTDRASLKNLKLSLAELPKNCVTYFDADKIREVMFNFVDNAIKYTEKGEVHVWLQVEKHYIIFRVKDTGIGFNKIDEASFFQKFYRGDNVKTTDVNGTGLGLYVCKMFIDAHRGKVWAHSGGVGTGSEFGFWIPKIEKKQ